MQKKDIKKLLSGVKDGKIRIKKALLRMKNLPFEELGYATIDHHRELRVGYPEIIYGEGKSTSQILGIVKKMVKNGSNILITRTDKKTFKKVKEIEGSAKFNKLGRTISIITKKPKLTKSYIAIVAAGTSDMNVVEEAYETALILGNRVEKIVDVGVAGIHRLFSKLDLIENAKVVIVIAGMEGALASAVGGLISKPIIAVPTSVGYGANFGGLSALLSMLNSCASGISVVNIDNGFGGAYSASIINHLR